MFARSLTVPNVIVIGHQAFFTAGALRAIAHTTLAHADAFAAHGLPLHAVSSERVVRRGATARPDGFLMRGVLVCAP